MNFEELTQVLVIQPELVYQGNLIRRTILMRQILLQLSPDTRWGFCYALERMTEEELEQVWQDVVGDSAEKVGI